MKKNINILYFLIVLLIFFQSHTMDIHLIINDINTQDQDGNTPLFYAVANEDTIEVDNLLSQGANPSIKNNEEYAPIHEAASRNLSNMVEKFLHKNVSVDYEGYYGITPLHIATKENASKVVKLLLKHGARIDHCNRYGVNALHIAAEEGFDNLINLFLSKYNSYAIALNAQTKYNKNTPLHRAVIAGHYEIVKSFLDSGSKINAQNRKGDIPLLTAIKYKRNNIAQLFLEQRTHIITEPLLLKILHKAIKKLPSFIPTILISLKIQPDNNVENQTNKEALRFKIEYLKKIFKKNNPHNLLTLKEVANNIGNKNLAQLLDWHNTQHLEALLKKNL